MSISGDEGQITEHAITLSGVVCSQLFVAAAGSQKLFRERLRARVSPENPDPRKVCLLEAVQEEFPEIVGFTALRGVNEAIFYFDTPANAVMFKLKHL